MADKKLEEVRTKFVEKVNRAVICAVLDDLLEKRVLNDEEVEKVEEKSVTQEQARTLIDVVRKKGPRASLVTIKSLCERDSFLAEQLGLMAFLEEHGESQR
ncbi:caspase recruitment domain-containing protein 16 [Heteronotia binoei]|uniref:caspase recruitment domain-containing protein 16 n=1 Tax=Heteronotia binoei TaxID=13085 RepID=UPI00292E89CF|nr:caspase recruitment domain-containing protein 16 [Heteronotia binoei]